MEDGTLRTGIEYKLTQIASLATVCDHAKASATNQPPTKLATMWFKCQGEGKQVAPKVEKVMDISIENVDGSWLGIVLILRVYGLSKDTDHYATIEYHPERVREGTVVFRRTNFIDARDNQRIDPIIESPGMRRLLALWYHNITTKAERHMEKTPFLCAMYRAAAKIAGIDPMKLFNQKHFKEILSLILVHGDELGSWVTSFFIEDLERATGIRLTEEKAITMLRKLECLGIIKFYSGTTGFDVHMEVGRHHGVPNITDVYGAMLDRLPPRILDMDDNGGHTGKYKKPADAVPGDIALYEFWSERLDSGNGYGWNSKSDLVERQANAVYSTARNWDSEEFTDNRVLITSVENSSPGGITKLTGVLKSTFGFPFGIVDITCSNIDHVRKGAMV